MNTYELIAPCHFGLEAVLKREIYDLGYEIVSVENGKVTFTGDAEAICRANINLRTAERVLLKVGQFKAVTFTELFDNVAELPWDISNRGGHDGGEYCTGHEPGVYGRAVGKSDTEKRVVYGDRRSK